MSDGVSGEHLSTVGQPERATQNRVVALFRDELGYRYLGDWTDRDGNSNIEEGLLSTWLIGRGHSPAQIGVALHKLRTEAANQNRTLYGNNQAVYSLLRYGVPRRRGGSTISRGERNRDGLLLGKDLWTDVTRRNCYLAW